MTSEDDRVLTALDFPPPHLVEFGRENRFRGMVLDSGGRVGRRVRVRLDYEPPHDFPADRPSEDLAIHLPRLPAARNCRFEFALRIPESSRLLRCAVVWENGEVEDLFSYDLAEVRELSGKLDRMRRALEAMAMPPGELVALTQGHRDVDGYRNSIIPGVSNMQRYLMASGVRVEEIDSVLDFGCGSGRVLTGWFLENERRKLIGCEPDEVLSGWARAHLPGRIRIDRTSHFPPLPYGDAQFDLVFATSVFTHLRLSTQQRWARELARVVAPGGSLLVTTHGSFYVGLFAPERVKEFERQEYIEAGVEDGSIDFATFHVPRALDTLFDRFQRIGHFPAGRIEGKRVLFPLAGLQDVSVFRRDDR